MITKSRWSSCCPTDSWANLYLCIFFLLLYRVFSYHFFKNDNAMTVSGAVAGYLCCPSCGSRMFGHDYAFDSVHWGIAVLSLNDFVWLYHGLIFACLPVWISLSHQLTALTRGKLLALLAAGTNDAVSRRNFGESAELYIRNCLYDAHTDPLCPAFSLGKIIAEAKEDYHQMAGSVSFSRSTRLETFSRAAPGRTKLCLPQLQTE